MSSYPSKNNFCGGNFQDWLEVNLTERCNGNCSWCVEKKGWHPKQHVSWEDIASAICETNKMHVILLGGEPTLYKNIKQLIKCLDENNRKVYITTNGSMLNRNYVVKNLIGDPQNTYDESPLTGVNVSIHHYDMQRNYEITGLPINKEVLKEALDLLIDCGVSVRFNCNLIKGQIDSYSEILKYITFAREMGANKVRFAELKYAENQFVDLTKIIPLAKEIGLTNNPFKCGCNHDTVIDGMSVNFRQMCGLHAPLFRVVPVEPVQFPKQVLYYDGKIYDGWQTKAPTVTLDDKKETKPTVKLTCGRLGFFGKKTFETVEHPADLFDKPSKDNQINLFDETDETDEILDRVSEETDMEKKVVEILEMLNRGELTIAGAALRMGRILPKT